MDRKRKDAQAYAGDTMLDFGKFMENTSSRA